MKESSENLSNLLTTLVETDEGDKRRNLVDALFAIAEAIDNLAGVIFWKGRPDEEECICPECREAMANPQ